MPHKLIFHFFGGLCIFRPPVQAIQLFQRCTCREFTIIEVAKHPSQDIQFVLYHDDGMFYSFYRPSIFIVTVSISLQSGIQIVLDADVIHHQTLVLARINTVHTGYGLYQCMLLQRFVYVHGIEARHIKPRNPHIYHNGNLEVRFRILELNIQAFPLFFCTQQVVEFPFVVLVAGHDHFDSFQRKRFIAIEWYSFGSHVIAYFFFFNRLHCPFRS